MVDYVRYWTDRAETPARQILGWMGVPEGTYYKWRKRYGKVNEHNGWIPRDHWLEDWEKRAIIDYYVDHPLEGYRRLTYMMLDADVVALQEVARGWPLTSMTDMDAWLRAQTDLTIAYAPAADRQFGNALVARVPLSDVTTIDLGQGGGAQRRSALRAVLDDDMVVYGTHLQARNTPQAESTRLDQMRAIVDDWGDRPATVVAGDLNPRNEYVDASETPPKRISNLEVFIDAGLVTTQPSAER